ncbi:MAG: hypothetical protein COA42_16805 [Alteromonadaceae bacterium]|nr:MAG: hypothetical protein COA42_16805 [Alteromonadaceae bacterium]
MHFVDRDVFDEVPTARLAEFVVKHKNAWATYNQARSEGCKPLPKKPPSSWTDDRIRTPLKKLFLKNCGYCGVHTDCGHDAEVDHYHPTSKDMTAEHVFEWENYIWSCHPCNGKKKDAYPLLNPTCKEDVESIYFHANDGQYLVYQHAPDDIVAKYQLTVGKTNLNDKNCPQRRKGIYRQVNVRLNAIKLDNKLYLLECGKEGKDSPDSIKRSEAMSKEKSELLALIKEGEYLFLIKHLINEFRSKDVSFPYTFDALLAESGYLDC